MDRKRRRLCIDENVERLWHVQLCLHGPRCIRHERGRCGFAHGLDELMAPDERDAEFLGYWRDGVDRWYGQEMHREQLRRIKMYWSLTPREELPVWAKALDWFIDEGGPTEYPELPWDFGLWADYEAMRMKRKHARRPFQWVVRSDGLDVWTALSERRARLRDLFEGCSSRRSIAGEVSENIYPRGMRRSESCSRSGSSSPDTVPS